MPRLYEIDVYVLNLRTLIKRKQLFCLLEQELKLYLQRVIRFNVSSRRASENCRRSLAFLLLKAAFKHNSKRKHCEHPAVNETK